MAVSSITALMDILKLDSKSVKNENEVPSLLSSHVQSEPKVLAILMKSLVDLISSTGNEQEVKNAVGALNTLESLAKDCMLQSEPHLLANLSAVLTAASNKQVKVRNAAEAAAIAITSKMSPNAVRDLLPVLFKHAEVGVAWQTRALCLKIVASLSDHAPEQLGHALPEVVPQVTLSMSEPKKEVVQLPMLP